MSHHPNRSRNYGSYVIRLANGNFWKNLGAETTAVFLTLENAQATIAGFSGRGALANPKIMRVVSATTKGSRKIDGYYVVEV